MNSLVLGILIISLVPNLGYSVVFPVPTDNYSPQTKVDSISIKSAEKFILTPLKKEKIVER